MHEQPPVYDPQSEAQDFHASEQELQQATLFEGYADTVVTMYNRTGTISELLKLCPVPESQRSVAATESFVARVLEKNGIEVPEQFAHLRSKPPESKLQPTVVETVKKAPQLVVPEKIHKVEVPTPRVIPESLLVLASLPESTVSEAIIQTQDQIPMEVMLDAVHKAEIAAATPEITPEAVVPLEITPLTVIPIQTVEQTPSFTTVAPIEVATPIETEAVTLQETTVEQQQQVSIEQQVGDLYQTALYETSSEQSFVYHETDVIEDRISDVLDVEGREAIVDSGEALFLPVVAGDEMVNMLSVIASSEVIEEKPAFKIFSALPTVVETTYNEFVVQMAEMEPAAVEELTELVETIELVAERLQVLVTSERGDGEEATQIEAVLEVYYEELCSLLGIPVEPEERQKFIAAIRSDSFTRVLEQTFDEPIDEGMREMKHDVTVSDHTLPILLHQTANLTRFIMKLRGLQPSV